MAYTYLYPRPMLTVDAVVVTKETEARILLIQRKNDPYKNSWALPGGFVDMDEDLQSAAQRELFEETGLELTALTQFKAYGKPGRDPRGRNVSVVYFSFLEKTKKVSGNDDALKAEWFLINDLPELAFDHGQIILEALQHYSS